MEHASTYRANLAALPDERVVEIDYDDLVADPEAAMQRLHQMLGVPLTGNPERIRSQPRRSLKPIIAEFGPRLDRLVAETKVQSNGSRQRPNEWRSERTTRYRYVAPTQQNLVADNPPFVTSTLQRPI